MFIVSSYCISPQLTYDESCFNTLEPIIYKENKLTVIEPTYNKLIPMNLLRRMGRAVRIGVGSSIELIIKNEIKAEGIIFGSAVGGLEDCIKFLNQIYHYQEGNLTPTNFVQSTPNAIAGSLALLTQNYSYNMTHVNGATSFTNVLLDAEMLFEDTETSSLLIGSVEEISSYNYNINYLAGCYKSENIPSNELFKQKSKGSICGEGAVVFNVQKNANNYEAELVDFKSFHNLKSIEEIKNKINTFLQNNHVNIEEISDIILGFNGDVIQDEIYTTLGENAFKNANIHAFKHLIGEYPTAASFALWQGIKLLENKNLPQATIYKRNSSKPTLILIYNHYLLEEHSLFLLRK